MKVTNLSEVTTMFNLMDKVVPEAAREVLKQGAEKIKDTARAFAPVDEGRLEKAIHILPYQGNQFMLRIVIDVSGVVDGRDVSEYAAIVHEYPWSKRGPLTRVKGPRAGPKYMVRAVEEHRAKLIRELQAAMQTGINQAIDRSRVNSKARKK